MTAAFFCRHGRVGNGDFLSEEGKRACELLREQLRDVCDFNTALVSPTGRCLETAAVLMKGATASVCIPHVELHTFVDYRLFVADVPIEPHAPLRYNFSNWPTVLALYQQHVPGLVVGHDSVPVILAFKLLEQRGVKIDWLTQPRELTDLGMGCGVLVEGDSYRYVGIPKTRH